MGAWTILIVIVVASVAALLSPALLGHATLRPYLIARGTGYWRLLTSGFVHADIAHLAFNLITFYSFGFALERAIGTSRFVALYFCGLLISGIGTCIKHRNEPNYASLGASGAILAVLFASIVYFPHSRLLILPLPIPIPAPLFALLYLAGAGARELLTRGCRLDLDRGAFPPGSAAATLIAQVSVILAALDSGFLLLTPATTARHLREWLLASGAPFGLQRTAGVTVAQL